MTKMLLATALFLIMSLAHAVPGQFKASPGYERCEGASCSIEFGDFEVVKFDVLTGAYASWNSTMESDGLEIRSFVSVGAHPDGFHFMIGNFVGMDTDIFGETFVKKISDLGEMTFYGKIYKAGEATIRPMVRITPN